MAALGNENRKVDEIRFARGDGRQHGAHVGVTDIDGLGRGKGAAQFLELRTEHLGQLLGIDAAVMDGGRSFHSKLLVGKQCRYRTLDLVVVTGPQVAVESTAAARVRKNRSRV